MKLLGRSAIITGGTSGIGRATGLLFAREGAKVVLVGRDESKGKVSLEEIRKEGGEAVFVRADVSKSVEVKKIVERTIQAYGRIDILFNNAGVNPLGTAQSTSEKVWDDVIGINLTGIFLCCKYVIPYMLKQGGGVIINTGSVNSFMAWENEVAYDASKGGVLMFTKATALDFAKNNIRVNCICPGLIITPLVRKLWDELPDPKRAEEQMVKNHPMNRAGLPEEVAKVALFLASDDSSFVTGAAVPVDGGILAGWPESVNMDFDLRGSA
jgi:NAD(P)-dependent dehydrogenase (short-subunit alcohol dehydrogenase family)